MSLYKMELYKILRRPIAYISGLIMIVLLGFYFAVAGDQERSTVGNADPVFHDEAIRQDREITKEFEGILTDEKLHQIVEQYGFPSKTMKYIGGWWDENYLTKFVTDYFSDGYMNDWDDYQAAQELIPIKESWIYGRIGEEEFYFGYNKGWTKYIDFMMFAGFVLAVWLVILLSPVFSQELDTKMYPLIFTTENGRSRDVWAKLLAAFTVTLASFLAVAGAAYGGCGLRYGFDGAKMMWGFESKLWFSPLSRLTMMQFTLVYLLTCALALLMVCSYCVFASARTKSSFGSLVMAGALLILPIVIRLFGGPYALCATQPFFLVMYNCLTEITGFVPYPVYVSISVAFIVAGVLTGVLRLLSTRHQK